MAKLLREIIRIDEAKCNGCGACVPACREGALRIVDGKARLVSEVHCDGLGACIGHCPQGAITIEQREALAFDEAAVQANAEALHTAVSPKTAVPPLACGCPGTAARAMAPRPTPSSATATEASQLSHWPVKLALIPATAPWLEGAHLVLMADCVAVAAPALHREFLQGRCVAIACPKLDDSGAHALKLAELLRQSRPASIEVAMMEVPCCQGLLAIVQRAVTLANADIPISIAIVGVEGGEVVRSKNCGQTIE